METRTIIGHEVRVATTGTSRLLGLAFLDREEAPGLLLPGCRAVHTFGMHFCLDLLFLDAAERVIEVRVATPPRRLCLCRSASAVLELPAGR